MTQSISVYYLPINDLNVLGVPTASYGGEAEMRGQVGDGSPPQWGDFTMLASVLPESS
jgi:hypothetical protein